uniref:Uncharacterized protein n=1 Tax=Triticum urartu TaxID=4572 RepID=A0A8R7PS09_TRIUA
VARLLYPFQSPDSLVLQDWPLLGCYLAGSVPCWLASPRSPLTPLLPRASLACCPAARTPVEGCACVSAASACPSPLLRNTPWLCPLLSAALVFRSSACYIKYFTIRRSKYFQSIAERPIIAMAKQSGSLSTSAFYFTWSCQLNNKQQGP